MNIVDSNVRMEATPSLTSNARHTVHQRREINLNTLPRG
jgi:hypothetical protein